MRHHILSCAMSLRSGLSGNIVFGHASHSWPCALSSMDFPADIPALFVEELAETLPTCVCFHHEAIGSYFWSLQFFFDSMIRSLQQADSGEELNKFVKSVQQRLGQADAKELLGEQCIHRASERSKRQTSSKQQSG